MNPGGSRRWRFPIIFCAVLIAVGNVVVVDCFFVPNTNNNSPLKATCATTSREQRSFVVLGAVESKKGTSPSSSSDEKAPKVDVPDLQPSLKLKEEERPTNLGIIAEAGVESDGGDKEQREGKAATGTVNERLMAELEEAADKEKYGARSSLGKKLGLEGFKSSKTDEERQAAIEEARDLNGINPLVALGGSAFALAGAAGLWTLTSFLGEYFALHPVESDVYFVERVTSVFRNVVMGLVSLASGFFGVTGMGIFLLGVRVSYGVATGELDPTPIKKPKKDADDVELANVWDLMMNKKPGRRGGKKRTDGTNNPFGI